MKFDLKNIPEEKMVGRIKVGDMFQARGGRGDTAAWVVAAVRGDVLHMLGINKSGEIVSTASYGVHAMEDRICIGQCEGFASKSFIMNR